MTESDRQDQNLFEKMSPILEARGAVIDVDQNWYRQALEMSDGEIYSVVAAFLGGKKSWFALKAAEGLGPDDSSVTDHLDNLFMLMLQGKVVFCEDDKLGLRLPRGPEPCEEIKAQWPRLIEAAHRILPIAWDEVFFEPDRISRMERFVEERGEAHDVDEGYFRRIVEMDSDEIFGIVVASLRSKELFGPLKPDRLSPDDPEVLCMIKGVFISMAKGQLVFGEDGVPLVMNPHGPLPSQEIQAGWTSLVDSAFKVLPRAWAEVFPQRSFDWGEV